MTKSSIQRAFPASAILGFGLFWAVVMLAAARFPGYQHAQQYISELGATGAPDATWVSWAGFFPSGLLLMLSAALGAWRMPRSLPSLLGFAGLFYYALSLSATGVFPCDAACAPKDPTWTHHLHLFFGLTGYLVAAIALLIHAYAAAALWRRPVLAILAGVCGVVALAGFLLIDPAFPWHGAAQRATELSICIWWIALAALGLKTRGE